MKNSLDFDHFFCDFCFESKDYPRLYNPRTIFPSFAIFLEDSLGICELFRHLSGLFGNWEELSGIIFAFYLFIGVFFDILFLEFPRLFEGIKMMLYNQYYITRPSNQT